jgi:hypothetical protein
MADVVWNARYSRYELRVRGAAHDPVPATALAHLAPQYGQAVGEALTPNLQWDLAFRIGSDRSLAGTVKTRRFPSYVVYLTVASGFISYVTKPVYFWNANNRSPVNIIFHHVENVGEISW